MTWTGKLVVACGAYAVSTIALVAAASTSVGWLQWAAVIGLAVVFLVVHRLLTCLPTLQVHLIVAQSSMIVGVVLLAVWGAGGRLPGLGFAGVATLFLGLGELLSAIRSRTDSYRVLLIAGGVLMLLCALLFGTGLVLFARGSGASLGLVIGALALVPIGLGLLTEGTVSWPAWATDRLRGRLPTIAVLLVGFVLIVGGGVGLAHAGVVTSAVWAIAIGGFLLVGAIASNTISDIVAVAAIGLLVLANAPKPTPLDEPVLLKTGTKEVVVALGDSYSSGEGAKTFYEGTNTPGENACRRSPTAYPAQLRMTGPLEGNRVVFLACSGAIADQLWDDAQEPREPIDWQVKPGSPPPKETLEGRNQLDSFERRNSTKPGDPALGLEPTLVLVGIGGNDSGFGEVVQTCLAPGDCSAIGAHWLDDLPRVQETLEVALTKIKGAITAPVVVVPYPIPIRGSACADSVFTATEHTFLHGFTTELDGVLRRAAATADVGYLVAAERAFEPGAATDGSPAKPGLRVCDGEPDDIGVNIIAKETVNGSIEQTVDVNNWFHNSMHPNETGQRRVGEVVNTWIQGRGPGPDGLEQTAAERDAERAWMTQHPTVRSMEQIMGTSDWGACRLPPEPAADAPPSEWATRNAYCDPGPWIVREVPGVLYQGILPALALLLGAWLIWLRLIAWWRGRSTSVDTWIDTAQLGDAHAVRRTVTLVVLVGVIVVSGWGLRAASSELEPAGASYNGVQLAGQDLAHLTAICCPDPSGVLTRAVLFDVVFAAAYGSAAFVLGGLLAQGFRRWTWRKPPSGPPDPPGPQGASRPDRVPSLFALGAWVAVVAASLDEVENLLLLTAARGWADTGVWVARIGGVKWAFGAGAIGLVVIGLTAEVLRRAVHPCPNGAPA